MLQQFEAKNTCDEDGNPARAIENLETALGNLGLRTYAREARAVEGTHTP